MTIYLAGGESRQWLLEKYMRIYLAGGINGNLKPKWTEWAKNMELYLAGNIGYGEKWNAP